MSTKEVVASGAAEDAVIAPSASSVPESAVVEPKALEAKSVDESAAPVTASSPTTNVEALSVDPETIASTVVPAAANIPAEADDYDGDADSSLGVSLSGSSTNSVNSSIRAYRSENGRTYHSYKEGKYFLPNDEEESDRLDMQHHLWSLTLSGALVTFPIPEDKVFHRVLDIGTGTGIWALDWADEHPESEVIGCDLSPIQPQFVSPNCYFEVDDIEENWTYNKKFDLIHSRMMTGSIQDWPKLFAQAFENLNPGGYIQLGDVSTRIYCDDNSVPIDSEMVNWVDMWREAAAKSGRPSDSAERYKSQLEAAGFVDVVQVVYKWPITTWARDLHYKTLGLWCQETVAAQVQPLSLALFTRYLGMSVTELEVFLVNVRKEMKDTRLHGYYPIYTVYGRKPE